MHPAADKKAHSYILLNLAGKEAIERARSSIYEEGDTQEDVNILTAKFKALCEPKKTSRPCYDTYFTPGIKGQMRVFRHISLIYTTKQVHVN